MPYVILITATYKQDNTEVYAAITLPYVPTTVEILTSKSREYNKGRLWGTALIVPIQAYVSTITHSNSLSMHKHNKNTFEQNAVLS